jgi:hypothetical protein
MGSDIQIVHLFVGGIGLIALVTIIFMAQRRSAIVRALRDDAGFLEEMRSDRAPRSRLARAVHEHLVHTALRDGDRIVLSKPLPALRREYAENEVAHHWSFWIGGLLTGIALIATFLLIALVMKNEVSGAILQSAGADEAKSTEHLAMAVSLLGGKFFISAAGVAASVAAVFVGNWVRGDIYRRAEHPDPQLSALFMSVDEHRLAAKEQELALLRSDREARAAQHAEVCAHFTTLGERLESLNSIQVSVKTIGNDVSANLKNIMKDAMGEQLKGMLSDTMADVANIAQRIQESLTDSFGKQLQALATTLQQSLSALQTAIEGQGQGHLEKILSQLQNVVSGGFQNESQNMVATLEGFARVVPALEEQLRTMTGKVAEETRVRGEENARLNQQLMARVGSLIETLNLQQQANVQAIERIQAASEHGAEAIARRVESSGTSLVSNVLAASRTEIEAIVGQLRLAADASSHRYTHIETQASNAASAVAHASESLVKSANAVIEVANETSALVAHTKAGSEAMQAASHQFLQAGNALLGSVRQMQQVTEATRIQTHEQQQLLLRQREYTKEVERLWPELFNTYLSHFKQSADELGRQWEGFHQKIATVSNAFGADFAHSTEVLSESVDRLVKLAAGRGAM